MDNTTLDNCDRGAWVTSYEMTMPFTVLQPTIMVLSILFNTVLLVTISCSHHLRTSTHIFMASLACSDITLSLHGTIYTAFLIYGQHVCYSMETSNILDRLLFLTSTISLTSNYLHIVTVSVERWLYIARPFLHQRIISPKLTVYAIVVLWVGSVFLNVDGFILPIQHYKNVSEFKINTIFPCEHLVTCLILCFVYVHLTIIIRKQMRAISKTRAVDRSARNQYVDMKETKEAQLTETTGNTRQHKAEARNRIRSQYDGTERIRHEHFDAVTPKHTGAKDNIRLHVTGKTDTIVRQYIETDNITLEQIERLDRTRHYVSEATIKIKPRDTETTDKTGLRHTETADKLRPHHTETSDKLRPHHTETADKLRPHHTETADKLRPHHTETADKLRPHHRETADKLRPHHTETTDTLRPYHTATTDKIRPNHRETTDKRLGSVFRQLKSIRLLVLVFGTFLILLSPGILFHFYQQYISSGSGHETVHKILKLFTFSHGFVSCIVYSSQDRLFRTVLKTFLKKILCCGSIHNRIHVPETPP